MYSPITDRTKQTYRMRTLVFCLLIRFLFVNGDNGVGFSSLITVAKQLEVGRIPMPLCMAEMITSLDAVNKDPKGHFSGSPLLL